MKQLINVTMNNIAHFNVDKHFQKYLIGQKYSFPLSVENFDKIKNPEEITKISLHSFSKANKDTLVIFPNLKLIVTRSVGIDHIDLEYCKQKNITVKNIPDYGSYNIAEHALALLLTAAKNIIPANNQTHKGKFSYIDFQCIGLKGKTLGVIGTGKIGLELIKLCQNFEFNIIAFDIIKNIKASKELNFKYVSIEDLLKRSDFISIHIPLLPQTKHYIDEAKLILMKTKSILVNTSRGEIIDEKALIKHITKFKTVCLDVLENENNLETNNPILKLENIIITPHIAFFTDNSIKSIATQTNSLLSTL